jgi:pSer/pThr/pTyr-binding forkhead associated (FHA) protein
MPTLCRGYGETVLQKYLIRSPQVVLGREGSCDIRLGGGGVSRRHCQFVRTDRGYVLEDLGSANGTFVNGTQITGRELLADGDKIVVMGHILTYRTADDLLEAVNQAEGIPRVPTTTVAKEPATMGVSPAELKRRLDKIFKEQRHGFEDEPDAPRPPN